MFKTIVQIADWVAPSPESIAQMSAVIDGYITQGKYTGNSTENFEITGAKTIDRWDWVDELTAQDYINNVQTIYGPQEGAITTSIVPN